MMYGMYGYGMNGMHWGWGMGLAGILGIAVLIVLIWAIVKTMSPVTVSSVPPQKKSALDILKERYARGEINKEEFEEKKHALS